jgi:hypothetical protein
MRNARPYEPASPTNQEDSTMLPLLSLHAIAAECGDGLHPALLNGLRRMETARAEHAARESVRPPEDLASVPIADHSAATVPAKPPRAA